MNKHTRAIVLMESACTAIGAANLSSQTQGTMDADEIRFISKYIANVHDHWSLGL
jgi:hypothetical protein